MRWRHAGAAVLFMLQTGCPSEFGKDGRVNKAVHQDTMDLVIKRCGPREYEEFCGGSKRGTSECVKMCG